MKKNNKKGFTLVELVIVVAVMAVLVAVAIPTVKSIVGTAEEAVDEQNAKTIESMLKLEMAEKVSQSGSTATDLSVNEVTTALTDAALGIKSADFAFVPSTTLVRVKGASDAAGADLYIISYAADGTLTVTGPAAG